jgi:hypothetical protein
LTNTKTNTGSKRKIGTGYRSDNFIGESERPQSRDIYIK